MSRLTRVTHGGRALRGRDGLLAALLAWLATIACPLRAAAPLSWELAPYHVRAVTVTDDSALLSPAFAARLHRELAERVEAVVGAAWEFDVVAAPATSPRTALLAALSSHASEPLTAEELGMDVDDLDKLIIVAIESSAKGLHVKARELDLRTRRWGTAVHRHVAQRAAVVEATLGCLLAAFSPLAQIESVDGGRATLRLRAGDLSVRDASFAPCRAGDIWIPIVRQNRQGRLHSARAVDWTLLRTEETTNSRVVCRVFTGLRSALGGRQRSGFERLALIARPASPGTRLRLVAPTEPRKPLAGYEIYARLPDARQVRFLGRTDRDGSLYIARADAPLSIVLVKHGLNWLARLPMAPGLLPTAEVELPDDDQRLEVEGIITGIQEQLVDLVVRREVLTARARDRIENGELEQARPLIEQLRRLRDAQLFDLAMRRQQERLVAQDARTQSKIDKMFGDTRQLLARYLDSAPITRLERQLVAASRSRPSTNPPGTKAPSAPATPKPANTPARR